MNGASIKPTDPAVPDWHHLSLPDSWADRLNLWCPPHLLKLGRHVFGKRRRVAIPEGMPGSNLLPKYLLQEFHHLPNGNYSKRFTLGYINGFDRLMLGTMTSARQCLANWLRDCTSVLDVGTAGGRTAAAVQAQGVTDVWGIDPSPYLLQHAARRFPEIRFLQSTAENTPFPAQRFDGISVCFVLHELPPKHVRAALREFARILKPGGVLAVCEPARSQWISSGLDLWRQFGWRGVYFRMLARRAHEPFVDAWHKLDLQATFTAAGFDIVHNEERFPSRMLMAKRKAP